MHPVDITGSLPWMGGHENTPVFLQTGRRWTYGCVGRITQQATVLVSSSCSSCHHVCGLAISGNVTSASCDNFQDMELNHRSKVSVGKWLRKW